MTDVDATGSADSEEDTDVNIRYVVASLVAGVFFGGLGGGVAYPTLPNLGPILGITPFLVGIILSANGFVRLLANTPAGQVIDVMGSRRPMIAGFLIQGIAPFGYVLALHADLIPLLDSAEIFLLARAMWGLGSAFVFVGAFSTITHVTTPDNRGKWIGYMRGGQSLGFPTGTVVGGVVTDVFGYDAAFLVAGVFGLFAAAVAIAVLPNIKAEVSTSAGLRELPHVVAQDPRILSIGGVNFVIRFVYVTILSTIVVFVGNHGIRIGSFSSVGVSGAIMAVSVLAMSMATLATGRYSDQLSSRGLVTLPALVSLGVGLAIVGLFPTLYTTLLGMAMVGAGVGGTSPPLLALLGDISPVDQVGKLGGVYNVFGDLGATFGPVVAFPVGAAIGYDLTYLLATTLILVAGVSVVLTLLGADTETALQKPTER
ncbi:MAG: MFS transporter [Natronomonas sp.]|nr:MFS transporter [Natronomonas sp.]